MQHDRGLRSIPLVFAILLMVGCHVELVSDYDEDLAKAVITTQKEIDSFLQSQRNPTSGTDITYDGNKGTYNKIQVDLNTLVVLARSHPNNDPTISQVNTVIESVHGLEDVHRQRGRLSPDYVDQKQKDLMMMFSSIIRTENAKKAAR